MKSKASDDICTACSLSVSLTPLIWCIDCGDEVEIKERDGQTCRCKDCQKDADKKASNERVQRFRERQSHVTVSQ